MTGNTVPRYSRLLLLAMIAVMVGLIVWRSASIAPAGGPDALPRVQGDFTLLDGQGEAVSWSTLGGRRQLVFFGFTHCPDVCPLTLANASQALELRGVEESATRILFISVDPERDEPAVVDAWARSFGTAVMGLTGDMAAVSAAARAFHVYFEKLPAEADGSYMVEHAATLFLLGPDDELLELIPSSATAAEIAAALARH